jgi:hypothetical protein
MFSECSPNVPRPVRRELVLLLKRCRFSLDVESVEVLRGYLSH